MFKSYLVIALRVLRRNKVIAFINIAGLAVGMVCAALILLYVRHELSYDQYHMKHYSSSASSASRQSSASYPAAIRLLCFHRSSLRAR